MRKLKNDYSETPTRLLLKKFFSEKLKRIITIVVKPIDSSFRSNKQIILLWVIYMYQK